MMLSLFRVIRLIVTSLLSAMQLRFMNCGLPQSGVSMHLLFPLMCSPGHISPKMTSLTLTSASLSHGLRGNRLIVSWARRLEMLCFLDYNNEGNSVQKSNLDFWLELPVQMHRIYCHMTAKCDRFLSDPGQIQARPKGHCLPTWHLITSSNSWVWTQGRGLLLSLPASGITSGMQLHSLSS